MKPRIYIETSVVSYLTARASRDLILTAHQQITREWWDARKGDFELVTSQLVIEEAGHGDPAAAALRLEILEPIALLEQSEEAANLGMALIDRGAMPAKAAADALHVATTGGAEFLLTWNCRHINNARMRAIIEQVCRDAGFIPPSICSPEQLLEPSP